MPVHIYSYNQASAGSKALAEAMGIRRISHQRSRYHGAPDKVVINWGSSQIPDNITASRVINRPELIARASNKLHFFQDMARAENGPRIPNWSTSIDEVSNWLEEGKTICIRTILQGHSAAGLIIVDNSNLHDLRQAPLYTQYVSKKQEYRVHIFNGEVLDVQRKGLREDVNREDANWKIRNLANGFVFVRNDGRPIPDDVIEQAKVAMTASGLDFGAVDVIWNERQNQAYVLEINTAPGIMGTTLENYARAFREEFM